MKRRVEDWSVDKLHKARPRISFPEYQRQPNLWPIEKKRLLIDSILKDIDIPKLYFNETQDEAIEVIDGTQRLWSIWEFIDDQYAYSGEGTPRKFSELSAAERHRIRDYRLQVTILEDAPDDYLRDLFVRLQLGLLLVTGEKLNASKGEMKSFVFDKLAGMKFVRQLGIPKRRFAKETLCAQMAINSFTLAKLQSFARTRYEDLLYFFKEYEAPKGDELVLFAERTKHIAGVLRGLWGCFDAKAEKLTNRSYILSIYLLFEEREAELGSAKESATFVDFVFTLWKRLKAEARAGMDRSNRELYVFETMLSSAPGERYQIERRHAKLIEYYEYFRKTKSIKGDRPDRRVRGQ